ncbi:MAG: sugar ABC transporter ATP-binding protein, partial [Verrucomicrobia bacterium]|nr:sugar ABC transporter ATP-binding protein [Verrucomicrobiota bacterium]
GKSTLIKVLCGVWPFGNYNGRIVVQGRECRFQNPRDAAQAGISVVHQELSLAPDLSASENIFLGREPSRFGWIDQERMGRDTAALFRELHVEIEPDRPVRDLGMGQRQMVEIAKALSRDSRILVLDEPTSALAETEAARLHALLRRLAERGVGIIYISHRLNEVLQVSDQITVLRDGQTVGTSPTTEMTESMLVSRMVGREIKDVFSRRMGGTGETRLCVEDLSVADPRGKGRMRVRNVSFRVNAGEVLGIAGLVGAGRTELLEAIFGLPCGQRTGKMWLDGKEVSPGNPQQAVRCGIALVGEDRQRSGLVAHSVLVNVTLAALPQFCVCQWIDRQKEAMAARGSCARLAVKAASMSARVSDLSGGNQQKVVLTKWLMTAPKVMLMDEPTRGIDVNAKSEIYRLIRDLAGQGMAVVLVSSELLELMGLADRILVLSDGSSAGEFDAGAVTEEILMQAMTRAFAEHRHNPDAGRGHR